MLIDDLGLFRLRDVTWFDLANATQSKRSNHTKTHERHLTEFSVITILQCLTGNNICIVAISHCIVAAHAHLIVTIGVQVGQISMRSLHIQDLGIFLWVAIDPILNLKRTRKQKIKYLSTVPNVNDGHQLKLKLPDV